MGGGGARTHRVQRAVVEGSADLETVRVSHTLETEVFTEAEAVRVGGELREAVLVAVAVRVGSAPPAASPRGSAAPPRSGARGDGASGSGGGGCPPASRDAGSTTPSASTLRLKMRKTRGRALTLTLCMWRLFLQTR